MQGGMGDCVTPGTSVASASLTCDVPGSPYEYAGSGRREWSVDPPWLRRNGQLLPCSRRPLYSCLGMESPHSSGQTDGLTAAALRMLLPLFSPR